MIVPANLLLLCIVLSHNNVAANCPSSALYPLQIVVEHAIWRGWHQARIFAPDIESGCQWALVRLAKCLAVNGVASTFGTLKHPHLSAKVGIVILTPSFRRNATQSMLNVFKKLNKMEMNSLDYDWLIASRSERDMETINNITRETSIRFDQNILVAYPFYKNGPDVRTLRLCDSNFQYSPSSVNRNNENVARRRSSVYPYKRYFSNACRNSTSNSSCSPANYQTTTTNYYRSTERFRNLTRHRTLKISGNELPLYQAGVINYNFSKAFEMTNVSKFSLKSAVNKWYKNEKSIRRFKDGIYMIQYFKVRQNSSLYACFLGIWSPEFSMSLVEPPFPVEARTFLGEEMTVGRCNVSGDGAPAPDDEGPTSPAPLDDVLHFIDIRLNATSQTRYYSKLGFRSYEGAWTGLLGGLMDSSVDIALEPVTAHPLQHKDMDFIFPIAETMCNIYIRHQETSTVRDIFMAPFSPRLVISVMGMTLVAALAVVLISRITPSLQHDSRPMEYTEAVLWSTGIICQQGGTWTPTSPSASVLLIACLMFAVVTYNAYAAFITSVLSVRVSSLDTVAAVLNSPNIKIGYIKNGADQMYLMSTKDAKLNEFYIRGYSDAQNLVSSAEEGLTRAASEDYAFFAGQRAARSTLSSLSQARGRCRVRELPVHSTRADLAFPLPRRSPYAKPILLSLLQLRSNGALARLEAALVPAMPQCAPPLGFASAKTADVRSALILLGIGFIAAATLGVLEYCWRNRFILRKNTARFMRCLINYVIDLLF